MKFKARIDAVCLPADIDADYEVEDICIHVDLPFVPHAGMHLKVTPQGEFMTVHSVMLDLSPNGEGLIISMVEPDGNSRVPTFAEMVNEGWQRIN